MQRLPACPKFEDVQFGWRLQHVHTYIYMYVFIGVDVYLAIYSIHMMMNNSCGDCRYVPNLHTYKHICTNKYVQYICPHKLPCVGTCMSIYSHKYMYVYVHEISGGDCQDRTSLLVSQVRFYIICLNDVELTTETERFYYCQK